MARVERKVVVVNELGLHARPAAEFVKLAGKFSADIEVGKDDMWVNGKSIMGVMTLAAERGTELTIRAKGEDGSKAVDALHDLIHRGFGE